MGLDLVELVVRVEKDFAIEIPNADAARLTTVGEMHAYVVEALWRQGRMESSDSVYRQLRDLICDEIGVKPEQVIPTASFVDDLRMD